MHCSDRRRKGRRHHSTKPHDTAGRTSQRRRPAGANIHTNTTRPRPQHPSNQPEHHHATRHGTHQTCRQRHSDTVTTVTEYAGTPNANRTGGPAIAKVSSRRSAASDDTPSPPSSLRALGSADSLTTLNLHALRLRGALLSTRSPNETSSVISIRSALVLTSLTNRVSSLPVALTNKRSATPR